MGQGIIMKIRLLNFNEILPKNECNSEILQNINKFKNIVLKAIISKV